MAQQQITKGKLIVLEGIEGAGKSTSLEYIKSLLNAQNIKFAQAREPGGTYVAEKLRDIFKENTSENIDPKTEVLMLYAARNQLLKNMIFPMLADGTWVVCDRFYLSTLAYQGGGRMVDEGFLMSIHHQIVGNFTPDLTIYLDIEPTLGSLRALKRGKLDRIEQNNEQFFANVRNKYLELIKDDPKIITIDANQSWNEVANQLKSNLEKFIRSCK